MAQDMQLQYVVDADYSDLKSLENAVKKTSRETEKGFGKAEKAVDKFGNELSDADKAMGRYVSKSGRVSEANGKFAKGFGSSGKSAGGFNFQLNSITKSLKGMAGPAAVVTTAVTATAVAIAAATDRLIAFGAAQSQVLVDLDNLSRNAGTALDTFQVLARESAKLGISQENLADILQDTSDRIGEFTRLGEGEFVDVYEQFFKPIGIGVEELRDMRPEEVLRILQREMEATGATSNEMRSVFEQVASNSSRLGEVWALSAVDLKNLKDEMEREGTLVTNEDIERAREVNIQTKELDRSFQRLKTAIFLGLEEPIQFTIDLVDSLLKKLTDIVVTTDEEALNKLDAQISTLESKISSGNLDYHYQGKGAAELVAEVKLNKLLDEREKLIKKIAESEKKEKEANEKQVSRPSSLPVTGRNLTNQQNVENQKKAIELMFATEREAIEIQARENEELIRKTYAGQSELINEYLEKNSKQKQQKIKELSDREAKEVAAAQKKINDAEQKAAEEAATFAQDIFDAKRKQKEEQQRLAQGVDPLFGEQQRYAQQLAALEAYKQQEYAIEANYLALLEAAQYQHEQNKLAIQEQTFRSMNAQNELIMQSFDSLENAATNVFSGMLSGTMSATEAMQSFSNAILNEAIGALVKMGIEQVKQAVIGETLQASTAATAATSAAAVSAAWQPAALAASIATQGAAATVGTTAYTTAMATSAIPFGGGRRSGGTTQAGKVYEFGEDGIEMWQSGGKNYMLADRSGNVLNNKEVAGGMGGSIQVVQNFSIEASATYDPKAMNNLMSATKAQTIQIMQDQMRNGGMFSGAK